MAERNHNRTDLKHDQGYHGDYWNGTAEQLIEAGIVKRHMLPNQPGRNKTSVTFGKRGSPDYIHIQKRSVHRYHVQRGIPEHEKERRKDQFEKERKADRERHRIELIQKDGPEGVRNLLKKHVETAFACVYQDQGGLTFHGPHRAVIIEHLAHIYRAIDLVSIERDRKVANQMIRAAYEGEGLPAPEEYQQKLRLVS